MSTSLERKIGSRLTAARRQAKISVSDLARMLMISDQEVLSLEAGDMRFSAQRISHLADVLQLEIRWFFSGLNDVEPCFDKRDTAHRPGITDLIATARSEGFLVDLVNENKQDQAKSDHSRAA